MIKGREKIGKMIKGKMIKGNAGMLEMLECWDVKEDRERWRLRDGGRGEIDFA